MDKYKQDLIDLLQKNDKPEEWYRNSIFLRRGKKNYIVSMYAEYLCEKINVIKEKLGKISSKLRKDGYKTERKIKFTDASNRRENNIARLLFKKGIELEKVGRVIDYEIPLRINSNQKIDLLCVNENSLNIVELKSDKSKESILKAILEIYTYEKLIDEDNWNEYIFNLENGNISKGIRNKKCIMLFAKTIPVDTITDEVKELLKALEISVYIYKNNLPKEINEDSIFELNLVDKI